MMIRKSKTKITSKHPNQILETDAKGHVWCDLTTLLLELGRSAFTWSGQLVHECERHYGGDRNRFRKVRGRAALWNATLILGWWDGRLAAQGKTKRTHAPKAALSGTLA